MSHKLKSHLFAAATLAVLLVIVSLLATFQRSLTPGAQQATVISASPFDKQAVSPRFGTGSTLRFHSSAGPTPSSRQDFWEHRRELQLQRRAIMRQRAATPFFNLTPGAQQAVLVSNLRTKAA